MGVSTMSDYERNVGAAMPYGTRTSQTTVAIDQGLRAYMLQIYNYMVLGLAITGLAALGVYMLSVTADPAAAMKIVRDGTQIPMPVSKTMFMTPIGYYVFVSPLRWAIVLSFGIDRLRPGAAQVLFWIFAALMGLSLGSIFLVFTQASIVRVFFITAASFGALSLWGYTTKRDITGMGSFLIMGLFGVILASLVNIFLQAPMLQWAISVVGVLVFAGLTAYDTQRLKNEYLYGAMDGAAAERSSIMGALSLYLNFVNLFTLLLQLLGQREE